MRSIIFYLTLIAIFLFMTLGNFPKIIGIGSQFNNILITEVLLYLITFIYCINNNEFFKTVTLLYPYAFIFLISCCFGIVSHGLTLQPVLYTFRYIFLIFSGIISGSVLYKLKSYNISPWNFLLLSYFFILLIGIALYILFPDSTLLWLALSENNIEFQGDPHQLRFYSSYLDPNYYAAIILIPIIISYYCYTKSKSNIYLLLLSILIITLFLSGSRSGITTGVLLLIISKIFFLKSISSYKISKRKYLYYFLVLITLTSTLPIYKDNLIKTFDRIKEMNTDGSTQSRIDSFEFGNKVISENFYFGVGYNYLSMLSNDFRGLNSLDSSLQSILCNFGIILTLFLVFFILHKIYLLRTIVFRKNYFLYINFFRGFLIYILIIVLFTSTFNDLLFYPFWLFPIITIFSYLNKNSKNYQLPTKHAQLWNHIK